MGDFKYEIVDGFNHTFDEKGNTFLALRKIKWGDSIEAKLDIRKYYNTANGERMDKGVSFLTSEGPNELICTLLKTGYGDTEDVITEIKDREDFLPSLKKVMNGIPEGIGVTNDEVEEDEEDLFDPRSIFD